MLLSLLVTFEGVYQKKYLNILECSFLLNLGLLSALAAVYQDHNYKEELVTIISVSAALATFIGILLFHVLLRAKRSKCFRKYVKRFRCEKNKDSEKLLDGSNKLHSQPTSSDVFLKRESLIECSSINFWTCAIPCMCNTMTQLCDNWVLCISMKVNIIVLSNCLANNISMEKFW